MIFDAILFAALAHSGQFRKGSRLPYLMHPLGVAKLLKQHGYAEPVVVAGVLHDTLEDTPASERQLRARFGAEVAGLVLAITEPDKGVGWEERKSHTLRRLEHADPEVLALACADKLDNIRSIREDLPVLGEELWTRFSRPRADQQRYYRALAGLFSARMTAPPGDRLAREFAAEVAAVFPAE
jgi:(p)ppGpp synthase/HD superfamily hydrolase